MSDVAQDSAPTHVRRARNRAARGARRDAGPAHPARDQPGRRQRRRPGPGVHRGGRRRRGGQGPAAQRSWAARRSAPRGAVILRFGATGAGRAEPADGPGDGRDRQGPPGRLRGGRRRRADRAMVRQGRAAGAAPAAGRRRAARPDPDHRAPPPEGRRRRDQPVELPADARGVRRARRPARRQRRSCSSPTRRPRSARSRRSTCSTAPGCRADLVQVVTGPGAELGGAIVDARRRADVHRLHGHRPRARRAVRRAG